MNARAPGIDDVRAAADRLAGIAHRTPVLTSRTLDERVGASVLLKCESFQRGGSFKFRGAYNAAASMPREAVARGIATYSSGNHAQAVALTAHLLGTRAVIVMPEDAPASKLAAARGYGAEIVLYDRYREDREELGRRVAEERGLTLIPPYEHPMVIAGQGTAALELLEGTGPRLDAIIVPVGGGGLLAGSATWVKALSPSTRVIGVEPVTADDTRRSLERGERVSLPDVPRTIADGLQAREPGELTFSINCGLVDAIVTVTDEEIVEAMVFAFERMKIVVEPSGAVGLAAVLNARVEVQPGARAGVIVSGGNVAADRFRELTGT